MPPSDVKITVEYRIISRKKRSRLWRFLAFSGSHGTNRSQVHARMERAVEESPAYAFKMQTRTVETIEFPWRDV